jgi:hypothetical protein
MHTVDPSGAILDAGVHAVESGVPVIGHDYPPQQVAEQTLNGPWGSAWYGNLVANRKLPYSVHATHWGGYFVTSFQAADYGLACRDSVDNSAIPFIAHWRREPKVAKSYRDVATLIGRYGINQTNLLSASGGGITGPHGGSTQSFQHRARMLVVGHADKSQAGQATSSQLTFGLLAFAAKPKVRIDGKEVEALPAQAKIGQRIVIHDGISYCAILPLLATDLGRDVEVEIVGNCVPMQMQGGGKLSEYLRINIYNHHGAAGMDPSKADQGVVVVGIQVGSAETYKSVEGFEKALATDGARASMDPKSLEVQATWKSADGTMELECSVGSNKIKKRVVDGQPVTLPNGTQRECDLIIQGSGTLKKNGATLVLGRSRGLLITDPVGGCYEGWNGLPDPIQFSMSVPGGSAVSDGLVSTCRVFMDLKNSRVEIDAVVPERNGARTMSVTGLSGSATVVVNGRTVKSSPGAIPLLTPPLDPSEADGTAAWVRNEKPGKNEPVGAAAKKDTSGSGERDTAAQKAEAGPAALVVSPEVEKKWNQRLFARVRESLAGEKRKLAFVSVVIRSKVVIQSVDDKGQMSIAVEDAGAVSQVWGKLKPGELKEIAISAVRPDSPSDSALAAFFSLVAGDRPAAEKYLNTAGSAGSEVTKDTASPPDATVKKESPAEPKAGK